MRRRKLLKHREPTPLDMTHVYGLQARESLSLSHTSRGPGIGMCGVPDRCAEPLMYYLLYVLLQNHVLCTPLLIVSLRTMVPTAMCHAIRHLVGLKSSILIYNSSLILSPSSGIAMILTTKLVHPVKCWVRCPLPVSGLYCSHANPVSFQLSKTVVTRFFRSSV